MQSHPPVVAHLKTKFLLPTQNPIYNFLAHAKQSQHWVLTDIAYNQKLFPTACIYITNEHQLNAWHKKLGRKCDAFVRKFLNDSDYPNCFESFVRKKQCNLLHAHFGEMGYRTLQLKQKLNMPLITSFYGKDVSELPQNPKWKSAYRRLFNEGDYFLALGHTMASQLRKLGCPAQKIGIQHIGIDLQKIMFVPRYKPNKDKAIVLLCCCRLVEKKGIPDMIRAFSKIAHRWHNLELKIIGDGPLRPKIKQQIQQTRFQNRIILKRQCTHTQVMHEMQQAHLFIMPSITASNGDQEGTPAVLLEAQASGLPVLSTYHADIPEIVKDGQTGFLVPEGHWQMLAHKIDTLLSNPNLWAQFGDQGRRHIEAFYDIKTETEKLEKYYQQILQNQ